MRLKVRVFPNFGKTLLSFHAPEDSLHLVAVFNILILPIDFGFSKSETTCKMFASSYRS